MLILEEIRKKVQEKVKSSDQVVFRAYQCMIKYHGSDNCTCDYCSKISTYVSNIRTLRYLQRKYEDYYSIGPYCVLDYTKVREQQYKVNDLKIEKDQLKCL